MSLIVTEDRLFYLAKILCTINLLFCIALYVGYLSPCMYLTHTCNFQCCQEANLNSL